MSRKWYRVGEVAERAGVTVRTLHHYDEIGLLHPTTHTTAGHRLYGVHDLERLELILLYRQMGFSLAEIQHVIESGESELSMLLRNHISQLSQRIVEQQAWLQRLSLIATRLEAGETLSAGDLMDALEVTAMFDRYYTPEQLKKLEQRRNAMPDTAIEQVQRDWETLFAKFDEARCSGVAADDASLQPLVAQAGTLIAAFTGGNADIASSLEKMAGENAAKMFEMWGVSASLGEFYLAAMKAHS